MTKKDPLEGIEYMSQAEAEELVKKVAKEIAATPQADNLKRLIAQALKESREGLN